MKNIIYQDFSTKTNIENIILFNNTIWMTQTQIGKLYWKANSTISEHIKKTYKDWELKKAITSRNDSIFGISENTIEKSFKKPKKYYNLQVVIAVWFKVNSPQAVSFRTRANNIIEQYISKWYALDDEKFSYAEENNAKYLIRVSSNSRLKDISEKCDIKISSNENNISVIKYKADSWTRERFVIVNVVKDYNSLFPKIQFFCTNLYTEKDEKLSKKRKQNKLNRLVELYHKRWVSEHPFHDLKESF